MLPTFKHIFTLFLVSAISFTTFAQSQKKPCGKSVASCEGQITFDNGNIYNGEFAYGVPSGKGLMKFKEGSEYLGDFKNGKMEGQGAILLASGDSYIGDWKDGEADGDGTYKKNDGSNFTGKFKTGMRQGNGIVTWKTGDTLRGEWQEDKLNGKAIFEFANGDMLETNWQGGNMKVKSTYTKEDGQKIQGSMNTIYTIVDMENNFANTKETMSANLQLAWMSAAMEFKAHQNYDLAIDFLMAAQKYGPMNPESQAVIAQQMKAIDSQKNNSGWAQLPKK